MRKNIFLSVIGACAGAFLSLSALAQPAPEVTLTRFDCGTGQAPTDVAQRFTDSYAYNGLKVQFTYSCYLIKHGSDYLVWDTGQSMSAGAVAPKTSLVDQLAPAQSQARADQICRHQPLSRRSHRPGRIVSGRDPADRQGRLGRAYPSPTPVTGAPSCALRALDQRRRQGGTGAAGQGYIW